MTTVYLSLGSNIGNKQKYISQALSKLESLEQTRLLLVSSYYKTKPWGKTDQDDFLNIACQLETELTCHNLLQQCQKIEHDLDRIRHEHWGPRTIDIDILFFGHQIIDDDLLKLPHPYLQERAFVLVPLNEIASDFIHPVLKKPISKLVKNIEQTTVEKIETPFLKDGFSE
ncbi:2-amino-4-hydroxy-6-hydroxymethyldihydropteridine diphosphokinase [Streptococcus macacae]|uniref:2-amino-4-hydroxy-6-hydroxymethyldihydropteridine diphosphokinase n=1 Tax=Streptococcus macacae NCTC 11558 TaxID=764298 RepID=G5JU67_9STRE|nr:2-amino-4-hydroxy-6-hydroxymethyldihydropteridine diphosphokinase [Streptococcus macacae]EHJ52363.1 2-amino-4-hydroxy-6-hydroxymethyldihydropteridine diphosphokinase [Streptococcus macacae NCTC 11558]SUN78432.1 2-amino-4-hydroxy-6- hydroxymethylpteridine pyrophosphokinase [Streptococcus macacae NCTC 11558]